MPWIVAGNRSHPRFARVSGKRPARRTITREPRTGRCSPRRSMIGSKLSLLPVALQAFEFLLERLLRVGQRDNILAVVFDRVVIVDEAGIFAGGASGHFDVPSQQAHRALFALIELVVADFVCRIAERDADVVAVFGVRQAIEDANRRRLAGKVFNHEAIVEAGLAVATFHPIVLVGQLAAGTKLRVGPEADDERLAAGDGRDFTLADKPAVEVHS